MSQRKLTNGDCLHFGIRREATSYLLKEIGFQQLHSPYVEVIVVVQIRCNTIMTLLY